MLTAIIIAPDQPSTTALRGLLEQTEIVGAAHEWDPAAHADALPADIAPDVVLIDLPRNAAPYLEIAARLRQWRPAMQIVVCSTANPDPALLKQAMRSGVQEFLSKPLDPAELRDVLLRATEGKAVENGARDKVVVVLGSKGGVGTTTVAVNLAVHCVEVTKKRVLLLDFARPLGHSSLLLDLQPRFTLRDAVESLDRLDGHFLGGLVARHKTGLHVLAGAAHPEDWQAFHAEVLAGVINVAQTSFDHVWIDGGVQDPAEWKQVLHLARSTLLVAEPSLLSLWTLDKYLAAAESIGLSGERLQIVINRWRRADEPAVHNVEEKLHRRIIARLPNDFRQVSEAVTQGVPLFGNNGNALVVRYRQLVADLLKERIVAADRRRPLSSIFAFQR